MIIDSFTHMLPESYLDRLASVPGEAVKKMVSSICRVFEGAPHAFDPVRRVELLDKYQIDLQVVTLTHSVDCNVIPLGAEDHLAVARAANDSMASLMEKGRGRLLGVAAAPLDLLENGGLEEMDRAIKGQGLKGFCVPSNVWGRPLDAPQYRPFWAKAAELDVPVFIHPHDPVSHDGRPYEGQYDLTHAFGWPFETVLALAHLAFSGIMEQYPSLKVVSHHLGGGMVPFLFGRIVETYPPEKQERALGRPLTIPLEELFGRFYYDTAVGGCGPAIKCCYEVFGADHMLLSTDSPHGPNGGEGRLESYPRIVRECGIPPAAVDKINGGNAQKLLGIS